MVHESRGLSARYVPRRAGIWVLSGGDAVTCSRNREQSMEQKTQWNLIYWIIAVFLLLMLNLQRLGDMGG